MNHDERLEHVLVSLIIVAGMWLLLHMFFALHYAHTYSARSRSPDQPRTTSGAGCVLAGSRHSLYWALAHSSFIIGMTTQTTDITVTSLRIRRLVLFHGLLPFVFNTAIVTLSINILSGLL